MSTRFALVGSPIAHSRSPAMQNAALRALGIDAVYELRPTELTEVAELVAELRAGVWRGCNVTTPLKTAVAEHCTCDALAARAGAVNTVWMADGVLKGALTDIDGVREPLLSRDVQFDGALGEAVIVGAGGAARAALLALESLGARISVAARDIAKADALLDLVGPEHRGDVLALSALAHPRELASARVVIQATSVGRTEDSLPINLDGSRAIAFEMLYVPRVTPFLATAQSAGCPTIEGWEMLLAQGARSLELWLNLKAPRDVMREALLATL